MTNKKHCFILLMMVLILLAGTTMVSALEDTNSTQAITNTTQLFTPSNNDVDKVVQSEVATAASEADVENIMQTSDTITTTNNDSNTNEKTITKTTEKSLKRATVSVNSYQGIKNAINDVANSQDSTLVINLQPGNYNATSNDVSQWMNGAVRNIVINGNGITIDMGNYGEFYKGRWQDMTITLNNINFINGKGSNLLYQEKPEHTYIIENCTFKNYAGTHVMYSKGTVRAKNNTFINNTGNKGAVFDLRGSSYISNNTFINNSATDIGGVFYINNEWSNGEYIIENNIILNNSAYRAGVFGIEKGSSNMHIKNNLIAGNTAETKGAIADVLNDAANVIMENNIIENNTLPDNGERGSAEDCLFYTLDGTMKLINNTIRWNYGEGTSCLFNFCGDLQLYNNTIYENHVHGSSIFYVTSEGSGVPKLTMVGNVLTANEIQPQADYRPWIFYLNSRSDNWIGLVNITNNTFINNTVIPDGENNYEDVLFSDLPLYYQSYVWIDSNNIYYHNALNLTSTDTILTQTANDLVIDVDVRVRDVYNTTVHSGYVAIKNENGDVVGMVSIDSGDETITIPKDNFPGVTDFSGWTAEYVSVFKHYQNYLDTDIYKMDLTANPTSVNVGEDVEIIGKLHGMGSITLNVTVKNGNTPVNGGNVTVIDSEGNVVASFITIKDGLATITIPIMEKDLVDIDDLTFTAVYNQNPSYTTTVTVTERVNPLDNVQVRLNVGGVDYYATSNSAGDFSITNTTCTVGHITVIGTALLYGDVGATVKGETSFEVTEPTYKLNITAIPSEVMIGQKVNLTGYLTELDGTPISGQSVTILIDGDSYTATTYANGSFNITNTTTKVGNIPVVVQYQSARNTTSFIVTEIVEIPTNITIEFDPLEVGKSNTITFTLHNNTNEAISGQTVSYSITGTGINQLSRGNTNSEGKITATFTPSDNTPVTITAHFNGVPDVYAESTNATTVNSNEFVLIPTNITIANTSTFEVNKTTQVVFTLHNSSNQPISGKDLEITIGSTTYNTGITTNNNGQVTVPYTPQSNDEFTINVHFAGDVSYNESTNSTTVNSEDIGLTTSTIEVEATGCFVGYDVVVNGTLVNATGSPIADAEVILTFDNDYSSITTTTDNQGKFRETFTADTVGNFVVTATYIGVTAKVEGSTDTATFTVTDKLPSQIVVTATTDNGLYWVGENINISVELVTGNQSAPVTLTINGVTKSITLINGKYSENVTYNPKTNVTVKAEVAECNNYYADSSEITFEVVRIPTTTKVNVLNNTAGYVTVEVYVDGDDGKRVTDGNITVKIRGQTVANVNLGGRQSYVFQLGDNEYFNHYSSEVPFDVDYLGNNTYLPSEGVNATNNKNITNITVIPEVATLTLDLSNTIKVHDINTISGVLRDSNNNPITNEELLIRIVDENGVEHPERPITDSITGMYSITYNASHIGQYDVFVEWGGSNAINTTKNQSTFNVIRLPTSTTAALLNNTANNVQLSVNVTDTHNSVRVTTGTIKVVINEGKSDEKTVTESVTAEETIISLPSITTTNPVTINVTYQLNDEYENSSSYLGTLTPEIMKSNLTINVTNSVILHDSRNQILLEGRLVDGLGNGIKGTVHVKINDTAYSEFDITIDSDDGRFSKTLDNIKVGNFTINATYVGVANSINKSNASAQFEVRKIPTYTTVNMSRGVGDTIDVSIMVQNGSSDYVTIGNVTLSSGSTDLQVVNLADYNYVSIGNNKYITVEINLDDFVDLGSIEEITAKYSENEFYMNSSDKHNINEIKADALLKVSVNKTPVYINESLNITVNLTGPSGNPIKGTVELYINGELYRTKIVDDGIWNITYKNSTAKECNVRAVFLGNALFDPIENTTSFEIEKIPTKTLVSVHNDTWGNASIDIVVQDARNNNVITYGNVSVSIENLNKTRLNKSLDVSGTTNVPIVTNSSNDFSLSIHYLENDAYQSSQGMDSLNVEQPFDNITVRDHNSHISIFVNGTGYYYVGDVMRIYGTLTDIDTGEVIPGATIYVSVREGSAGTAITDTNGNYYLDYTTVINGTDYDVSVEYKGASTPGVSNIAQATNSTKYSVGMIPTKTSIRFLNQTVNNVTMAVAVNEFIDESIGDAITTGVHKLNVTVGNGQIKQYDITGEETVIELTDITDLSKVKINVTYAGTSRYINSSAVLEDFEAKAQKAIITVTATEKNIYVTESEEITGTLHDARGNPITGKINLTFSDDYGDVDGPILVNVTNGIYHYERQTSYTGKITVTASYLNDTFEINDASDEYNVVKIPTKTTVIVHNNTIGNVSINVSVVDKDGNPITRGKLNLTVDNVTLPELIDFESDVINIPINSANRNINVTVVYTGSNIYENSTAKAEDDTEFTNITTVNQTATLTIDATPNNGFIGMEVTIAGTLVDGLGNNITDDITLTFNNGTLSETYTVHVQDGKYSYPRTTHVTGTINVTAHYPGNGTIDPINASTIYTVGQIPTVTTFTMENRTWGNLTLNVSVIDNMTKQVITEGNITIRVSGANTYENLKLNGTSTLFDIDVEYVHPYTITVDYHGNYTYLPSEATNTESISMLDSHVTISATTPVSVGDEVKINGTLYDGMNNTLVQRQITIIIEGTSDEFNPTTNDDGTFSIVYTPNHKATFTAKVVWGGNQTVNSCENTTEFTVNKIPTNTSVEIVNNTVGNVILKVDVVDNQTHPITAGEGLLQVTIVKDDQTITKTYDITGTTTTITLTDEITEIGDYQFTIDYLGNDTYIESRAKLGDKTLTNLTVKAQNSSITVEPDPQRGNLVGRAVVLRGQLLDGKQNPIANAPITLIFTDDSTHSDMEPATTDSEGKYEILRATKLTGTVHVTARYAGSENGNISGCEATNYYLVSKIMPIVHVTMPSNEPDNVTYEIWFTENVTDIPIHTGSFGIKLNSSEESRAEFNLSKVDEYENLTLGENDHYYLRVDNKYYDFDNPTYNIVTYIENERYYSNMGFVNSMAEKRTFYINLTVNQTSTYVNEPVTVHIDLIDPVDGKHQNGRVKVKIGNTTIYTEDLLGHKSEYLQVPYKTGLDIPYSNWTKGFYNVSVEYDAAFTGGWNPVNNSTSFTILPLPTETGVTIGNTTYGNLTINVTVTDTRNGVPVTNGTLDIVYNGESHLYEYNNLNELNNIPIDYPEYSNDIVVTVKYLENPSYDESEATTVHIPAVKQSAVLTVVATPPTSYIGDTVKISGQLINPLGDVSHKEIIININDTVRSVFTDSEGKYTFIYDESLSQSKGNGTFNVTVTRPGYDTVYAVQNNTTFTVYKMPTKTTITILNNTYGNVTLHVKVETDIEDRESQPVTLGGVLFYNEDGQIIYGTGLSNGEATIVLPLSQSGNNKVTALYNETIYYLSSDAKLNDSTPFENITVENQTATITVDVTPKIVLVGESVSINGTLVDGMGQNITGEKIVIITVDGNQLPAVDVNDGKFTIEYTSYAHGVKVVNATFIGSDTIDEITSNNTNFTVHLMPTKTLVSIVNSTVGNVSISVNVTNNTGEIVKEGQLKVTVGDTVYNLIDVNSESGETIIPLDTIKDMGKVDVTVEYQANGKYNSSIGINSSTVNDTEEPFTNITPTKHQSILTIDCNKTVYIGQVVTIKGTLTLDNQTALNGENIVTIKIGNNQYKVNVTDGKFEYNYTTVQVTDSRIVTAEYAGNDDDINASSNTTTFEVKKLLTTTHVDVLSNVMGNVTLNVTVLDDINKVNVTNRFNNQPINSVIEVEYNGNVHEYSFTGSPVVIELDELTAPRSDIDISVRYRENNVYLGSNDDTNFNKITVVAQTPTLSISATPVNSSVEDTVRINGTLKDAFGKAIVDEEIIVTVNGTTLRNNTDGNGKYVVYYKSTRNGTFTANATFNGIPTVYPISNTTKFTVNKIPTTTNMSLLNSTVANVTIGVTVYDNQTNPITNGTFNVTVYNDTWTKTTTVNINGTTTIVNLNITDADKTFNVKVDYPGSNKYINSTAKYKDDSEIIIINTVKQNATLTIEAFPKEVYVGRNVELYGTLTDGMNNPMDAIISIKVVGVDHEQVIPDVVVTNGRYNTSRTSTITGLINVTAIYLGNDMINACNATTNYTIDKIPTKTELTALNTTYGNYTVAVKVTDLETGFAIINGSTITFRHADKVDDDYVLKECPHIFTIDLVEDTDKYTIDEFNRIVIKIDDDFLYDDHEIIMVLYAGNETYKNSNDTDEEIVLKENVKVSVNVSTDNIYINQSVNITVELKDSQNNPISGLVNLTIGNVTKEIPVDSTGKYIVNTTVFDTDFNTSTSGVYDVKANYTGDSHRNASVDTASFTVEKIPTKTTVHVLNNTYGNVTVDVVVNDIYDKIISNGTIRIILDAVEQTPVEIKDTNTTIVLNPLSTGEIKIQVYYLENDYYKESRAVNKTDEELNIIDVLPQTANLTVVVTPNDTYVGEIITITGQLTDGLGNNVSDVRIFVDVGGTPYDNVFTNSTGGYTIEHTTVREGEYTVTATWNGNTTVNPVTATASYDVSKINTTTTVTVLNNSAGNVTIAVNVTDNYHDNAPITKGNFNITIGENETETKTITGQSTIIKIDVDTNTTVKVNITYLGDDKYNPSNATVINKTTGQREEFTNVTTDKQNVTLDVGVVRESIDVGTYVYIQGHLRNATMDGIVGTTVELRFNGVEPVNLTTVADGYYNLTRLVHIPGPVVVTAYYNGSDKYNNATNTTNYIAQRLPTNTTVTIANNTVGNVSIDVKVTDMYHKEPIANGTLNVTVNNKTTQYNFTTAVINIPLNITNTTTANVTVVYTGNDTYLESKGYDNDQLNEFTEITADKQNATITLEVRPPVNHVLDDVEFHGQVLDGLNNIVNNIFVNITITHDDTTLPAKAFIDETSDSYLYQRHTDTTGEMTVTVHWDGNETVNPVDLTKTYNIIKRPTDTIVTVANSTVGATSIDVQVKDTLNKNILTNGTLTITVNSKEFKVNITGETTNIPINTTYAGYTSVTVVYDGNYTYNESTGNITNITTITQTADMTISNNASDARVGDTVMINGTLKDGLGKVMVDRPITVNVNGTGLQTRTDSQGNYVVYYNTTQQGNFTAVATFTAAAGIVGTQSVNTTFEVLRLNTTTVVEVIDSTAGGVTISVNVTDERNRPVSSGDIKVEIENQTTQIVTVENAIVQLHIDAETAGDIKVNVSYLGDYKYNPSTGKNGTDENSEPFTNITVVKQNVTLTVGTFRDHAYVTTGMAISGYLLNASGLPIANATITLKFEGNETLTNKTNDLGYYTIERLIHIPDNVTVVAYYNGSDKYNNATANTSYIGDKLPTNTTVEITNNTVGNIHIGVQVWDMYHTSLVDNGTVNITINGTTKQYNLTGNYTEFKLGDIELCNTTNVTVTFIGNETLLPSMAVTKDTFGKENETFTNIIADKQNAILVVKEGQSPVYVFNNVTYNGTLTDGLGRNITDVNITLLVYHEGDLIANITDVNVTNGFYTRNRTTSVVGDIEVIAVYDGNETINPCNASTTYEILKRPTYTNVTVVNDTMGNLQIDVEVVDALNNTTITSGEQLLTLSILEGTFSYSINESGVTRITVPVTEYRKLVAVTVRYNGDEIYEASTGKTNGTNDTFKDITAKLHNTTLSIKVNPVNSTVGNVYNISGYFVDENNTAIAGENIIVRINNTMVYDNVVTGEDGYYSVNYTSYREGNFTAKVEFTGNDLINRQTNNTTFTVNKIPTNTTVSIINNTLGHVQIGVNVTDEDGNPITKGYLEVTVDGQTETVKITGKQTPVDLDITTTDTVAVSVKYTGNDTYKESIGMDAKTLSDPKPFENITADKNEATVEVELVYDERFVGQKQNINIYLYDVDDEPIRGPVNITITNEDGTVIFNETRTTNRAGTFRLTISNATAGNIKVNASYESDMYSYTSDEESYVVNKIPTATIVDITSNIKDDTQISVRVMDTENNKPITSGNITLTVDNVSKNVEITGQDTVINITKLLDEAHIVMDENNNTIKLSVEYPGNDTYLNSTGKTRDGNDLTNITTVNTTVLITINADRPDIYVGEYITINGLVTLADGKTLVEDGYVIVRLSNGEEIRYDSPAEYMKGINNQYMTAGNYTANATYYRNDKAIVTSKNISLNVNKIPTITTVEILNDILSNVTIDITVRENVTDKYTAVITEGVLNVTIDGQTHMYPIQSTNTTIILDQITEAKEILVNVVYNGTGKYLNSSAKDANNLENNFTGINVTKIPTITNVEIINTTIGNVTIGVTVTNITGEFVTEGTVIVRDVDGNPLNDTILTDGRAIITVPVGDIGEFKVVVEYQENDKYLASNATNSSAIGTSDENITVINVTKIPTKTTVEVLDNTLGNVTIGVKTTNMTGIPVTEGIIIVKDLTGNPLNTTSLTDGKVDIIIPVDESGKLLVVVEYQENDIYLASNATNSSAIGTPFENITIIDVAKIPTKTTVEVLDTTLGNVTIRVKTTNMTGIPVTEGTVIVKDETGTPVAVAILNNGETTIVLPAGTLGEYRVYVEYQENNVYLASNATNSSAIGTSDENITVINVTKIPTKTSVDILDTTLGNVTLGVSVTNMTGSSVSEGTVIVRDVDGNPLNTTVLTDGMATVTVPVGDIGEFKVVVEYQENDIYLASNATNASAIGTPDENKTIINVTKIPTKTTLNVLNNTVGNVTVAVNVTNMTNSPVTKGTVVVKYLTGKAITNKTLVNGQANITIPVDETGKLMVLVEYQENDIYLASNATNSSAIGTPQENITVINVTKHDSKLTVNTTSPVKAHENITINGTLKDENNNAIANATVEISVDGKIIDKVTTDKDGKYVLNTTADVGKHKVDINYPGNDTYKSANKTTEFTVDKLDVDVDANVTDSNPVNTTIQVNVTDEDDKPVDNVTVVVKDENGTVIGNGTVTNGTLNITVPLEPGKHNITIETNGSDDYDPTNKTIPVDVPKHDTIITPDPIKNTTYGNTTQISGNLTDETGKPIPNANITITVNGEDIPVKTDENGRYNYTYPVDIVGVNNVTVKYDGDKSHEDTKVNTKFNVSKDSIKITVNPIKTFVEENIVLQANITDSKGNKINEGKVIFKLNGVTIHEGGKLTGSSPLKVPVVNGVAKYTFNATRDLISSKYIQAVYIANEHYAENRTDGKTPANVSLRTAQVIASTEPAIGKQRHNITLVANIYDITHKQSNIRPINDNASYVIFKVSGLTVKDNNGNVLKVPVVNGVAKTDYYIPNGMGGMKANTGAYKNYTVTAIYHHPDYYDVRNTSNFNIERANDVSFAIDNVTIDNRTVSIDGNLVESDGDNLIGNSIVGVKINGLTLKDENGKAVLFNANNGKVDIDFKLPDNVREVKNITLTTGNREAYGNATKTITNITKQASVITVSPVTGIVEENITLSARVTDKYGNPLDGGFVIYKFNGQTLRKGGVVEGSNPIVKIGVKNGWANYTFVANNKLLSTKKLDASYSGNANFNSSKTTTSSKVNISLRKAQVVVTATPNMADQNDYIVFTINVTDKTHNKNNAVPINSAKSLATIKINGLTLKDSNNNTVQVSIRNGTGSYKYRIPRGVGGKVLGTDDYKNYTVEVHYTHPNYIDAKNQTVYNIEQSLTSIQFNRITFNSSTKQITVDAQIKDYQYNDVVANTRFNLKVNGVTMKNESGDVIKYSSMDGKINLTIDSITSNPKEVSIVTLGREAYSSTRDASTHIIKV